MNKKQKITRLLLRYLFALALALVFSLFYNFFQVITLYPSYLLMNIIYKATLQGNSIIISNYNIEFVEACIASSAYLLLFMLNLVTPMNIKKRIYIILLDFFILLLFNISRIVILTILLMNNVATFDAIHKFFWYFVTTAFIVIIWLLNIKIFNLKKVPVYSDVKFILQKKK